MMVQVSVESVRASLMSPQRLVILKAVDGDRHLPIWIGAFEADAIAMVLQGVQAPRPMSHDLLGDAIIALGATVSHVVVHDLRHDVFYASVVLGQGERELILDSRPSDSIALAVRMDCPIYVESSVIDRAGIVEEPDVRDERKEPPDEPDSETLEVFREFIEELSFDATRSDQEEDG